MSNKTLSKSASYTKDGAKITATIQESASGSLPGHDADLANAGLAGTLSTRTDNDTGILTVASGHGITTSDLVDVYWTGGVRYGMTVTATTATTISIDSGAGDNLPDAASTIVVGKVEDIDFDVDGANIKAFCAVCNKRCHLDIRTASASVKAIEITAGGGWDWLESSGIDTPFSGTITTIRASCGETTAGRLQYEGLFDDTP